jgi:hypothetical protein
MEVSCLCVLWRNVNMTLWGIHMAENRKCSTALLEVIHNAIGANLFNGLWDTNQALLRISMATSRNSAANPLTQVSHIEFQRNTFNCLWDVF